MDIFKRTFEVTRDGEGLSTSVTFTIERYESMTYTTKESTDTNTGVVYDVEVPSYTNKLGEKVLTYDIPAEDRTTAYHADEHPHDYENEMAFQRAQMKWHANFDATDAFKNALEELRQL